MMETNVPNVSNTPSTMFVHWWNSFVMVTILLFLAHGIPTVSAEYHFGRRQLSSDSNCTGILCGNRQLPVSTNPVNSEHRVKILVFSVWVGDNPLNVSLLNHQLYCDRNGYEYKHFYMTREEFSEKYTGRPGAWLSVFAARDLLATSKADYFFKLDIDCVFARSDIRLEALLDPQQRYSFYTTHISQDSIFMQSQSWILKNSDYSRTLIKEWIEYVGWGNCGDLAYEQGAMHLMIGMAYSWHLGDKGTKYTCPNACKFSSNIQYAVLFMRNCYPNNGPNLKCWLFLLLYLVYVVQVNVSMCNKKIKKYISTLFQAPP